VHPVNYYKNKGDTDDLKRWWVCCKCFVR